MKITCAVTCAAVGVGAIMLPETSYGQSLPDGVRIGHASLSERPTGCTVVLFDGGAVAGVDVRGSAPGTRETDLLNPTNTVQEVHALVLSGGSAFGLDAASGVMRFLEENDIGYVVSEDPPVRVPIVPAAILFDLFVGDNPGVRPGAECGYSAAASATAGEIAEGNVGAGTGATVGKMNGMTHAMKSGIGVATLRFEDGLQVTAIAAVNAMGDVIDPSDGRVVAGVRGAEGQLLDARQLILEGAEHGNSEGQNTSLAIVVTNATLTKAQATKIAQMGHDGFARTIYPVHTPYDGDVIFAAATGQMAGPAEVFRIGSVAAEVVARAVLRAVMQADGIEGLPSASDLSR